MGRVSWARTRKVSYFHVAQTIVNTPGWLAVQQTHLVGAPMVDCVPDCWITAVQDVADARFVPDRTFLAVAKKGY
eukprot:9022645-Lingulodinium_polyedra.AAC.1